MTRGVFIGAVEFSARCLQVVLDSGMEVAAVLCPRAPGINADFRDLTPLAESRGVPVRRFARISDETDFIGALKPDIVFVLGLSQILPPALLRAARLGVLGSHPALLPENRGRHPIVWALANGLSRSGLTLFWLDEGVDSGDIWKQRAFDILPDDDAGTVYAKVCLLGEEMLREGLPELLAGRCARIPQDHSRANVWRKRGPADGLIDWRMSSARIDALVRALRPPYVGAHCLRAGKEFKVWRVRPEAAAGAERFEPGRVLAGGERPLVKTGDGAVVLLEWEGGPAREGDYIA